MDPVIHMALSHPHEVLNYAIGELAKHRGMSRQEAIAYIAKHHANCRNGRECPWMPQPPPVSPERYQERTDRDPEWFLKK